MYSWEILPAPQIMPAIMYSWVMKVAGIIPLVQAMLLWVTWPEGETLPEQIMYLLEIRAV